MEEARERLVNSGDSPSHAAYRFQQTLRRLYQTVREFPSLKGSPLLLFLSDPDFPLSRVREILEVFVERAVPLHTEIKTRNLALFIERSGELFPNIPREILGFCIQVVQTQLSKEEIEIIFGIVDALLRISMKYQIMQSEKLDARAKKDLEIAILGFGLEKSR